MIDQLMVRMRDRLGVTSIVITHDMRSAYTVGTRIAMLYQGRVRQVGNGRRDPAHDRSGRAPVHRRRPTLEPDDRTEQHGLMSHADARDETSAGGVVFRFDGGQPLFSCSSATATRTGDFPRDTSRTGERSRPPRCAR